MSQIRKSTSCLCLPSPWDTTESCCALSSFISLCIHTVTGDSPGLSGLQPAPHCLTGSSSSEVPGSWTKQLLVSWVFSLQMAVVEPSSPDPVSQSIYPLRIIYYLIHSLDSVLWRTLVELAYRICGTSVILRCFIVTRYTFIRFLILKFQALK